jgi:putative ABC transport system permease protein
MGKLLKLYNLRKIVRVAFRSLLHQKLRSLLSVLGVVCGVMAVVAMISIGEGAKQNTVNQIEQLGTRNIYIKAVPLTDQQMAKARERRSMGLTIADLVRIHTASPGVEEIACLKEIRSSILGLSKEISPQVVACSANYAHLLGLHISIGRFIAPQDNQRKNLVCVLGSEVAKALETLGLPGRYLRIGSHMVKVVGVLDRIEPHSGGGATVTTRNHNQMVFVPLETAGTLAGGNALQGKKSAARQGLSEIIVQVARGESVETAARLIQRIMSVAHHGAQDYQFVIPLELLDQAKRTQRTFNLVLGAIAGISLLVGGIGIMNIMLATVSERTREIGIRRAVGATRRHIVLHFLLESAILTLSGGFIGLLCGMGAVGTISWIARWPVAVSLWVVVLPVVMSFGVGIFFGLYPARQAAQVDPIVALRQQF